MLKPNPRQKEILKQWLGIYRWVFNWTIDALDRLWQEYGVSGSYKAYRKEWIDRVRYQAPWVSQAPAHTIYGAMQDAERAYRGMVRQRSDGQPAELPRCRKRTQKSFFILGNCINSNGIYPRLLGALKTKEGLPNKPRDGRILYECGRWYFVLSESVPCRRPENQGTAMAAIDPGVRTFATVFSPQGIAKIGDGSIGRIVNLCQHLDDLLSRSSKVPAKRRRSMRKAASRLRRRIRRLVDDMHYQTIGWLMRHYDIIAFPHGDFTDACQKARRKIRRKSVRSLLSWSFARFRDRLLHKAKLMGKSVLVVHEGYTSKTANWTGEIVHNLGGRRSIASQGVRLERDVNGALGIYLRALLDQPLNYVLSANVSES